MEMDAGSVKALKYLIRVSPPGEMQDVLHHLSALVGGQDALEADESVSQQLRKWYETHRHHIALPDGRMALVTAGGNAGAAENGDFIYYDNTLKLTFSFNPFTLVARVESEEPMEQPTSTLHASLNDSVKRYCEATYRKGKVLYSVTQ